MRNTTEIKLEKRIQIINLIISTLTLLVIGFFGTYITYKKNSDELNLKYLEISISILKEKPKSETTFLRKWAINIFNSKSPIKMSESEKQILMENPLEIGYWNGKYFEYTTEENSENTTPK